MSFQKGINYSTEIERAVLGICVLEAASFGRVYGLVDKNVFYHTGHQIVFDTIREMYQDGVQIDTFTVADQIIRVKGIDTLEGHSPHYFVSSLTNDVVSSFHLEYHCYILKNMWMEREIITLTNSGVAGIGGNVSQKIASLQQKLFGLQNKAVEHDWVDMTQLMVDLYKHQEEMKITGGIGLPSGLKSLDRQNGGFQNGQLIVIGARPSVGKSAFIGGMAIEIAKKKKIVGFVSLEMSNTEIAARLAAYDTNTDFDVVYRGLYRDMDETHRLYQRIADSTSTLPIFVTDKTRVNMPEIRAKAEKLKAAHGLDCLFIDYLQLVSAVGGSYSKNRENEIAEMSRGCKIMAKELDIPVVLLCQLNRESTKRTGDDRYPKLSDLRESGAIEQDADVVMFLHRDFLVGEDKDENGNSTENDADLVVRKWRNGKSNFMVKLNFEGKKMKFTERIGFNELPPSESYYDVDNKTELPF